MKEMLMNIRQLLKKSALIVGFVKDARQVLMLPERWAASNKLKRYIKSIQVRKLQIGAGPIVLPGWLGTDLNPMSDRVIYLDATKPFPIEDDTFDYIHSEHMIEHIAWHEGLAMLRECQRILKPGGKIRIATPDLKVLINLYNHSQDSLAEKYIRWTTDLYLPGLPVYRAAFVINSIFYIWNHKFIYDG